MTSQIIEKHILATLRLLVSSPSLAKLLLNLPFGKLADSIGRRSLMVGGTVGL